MSDTKSIRLYKIMSEGGGELSKKFVKSKLYVDHIIAGGGLITIDRGFVYFYGLEKGAFVSLLNQDHNYWFEIKRHYPNKFGDLPFISLETTGRLLFIGKEKLVEILNELENSDILKFIWDKKTDKIYYKINVQACNEMLIRFMELESKCEEEIAKENKNGK